MPTPDGYLGTNFLLKLKDNEGVSPGTFTVLGGLKATDLTIANEAPDITNKDSLQWKTSLAGGIRSVSLSGSGIWRNTTAQRAALTAIMAAEQRTWRIEAGNGDVFEGKFAFKNYKRTGAHDGAEEFTVELESSGAVTFTAGAA